MSDSLREELRARLLATFRVEAREHLQTITTNLLALEQGLAATEASEVVETTFRAVHTLKGAARSVSLLDVEALCQSLESILSRLTRGELELGPDLLRALWEAADGVARLVGGSEVPVAVTDLTRRLGAAATALASRSGTPAPVIRQEGVASPPPAGPAPIDTIRLTTARLDALLHRAEDLLMPRLAASEHLRDTRELVGVLGRCRAVLGRVLNGSASTTRLAARAAAATRPAKDPLADLDTVFREAEGQARRVLGDLVRAERMLGAAVDGLHEDVRRLRLVPVSTALDPFPLMVRDLAVQQGKEVEWIAAGAELEVDRKVLEPMKGALIHLVRNAVDHGIERPDDRARAGKPRRGRVRVTVASLEGGRIELGVEDDGRGIDVVRLREAAVKARLLTTEQAGAMTEAEALDLIFRPGVSTSPIITDVSGHGRGLAIVKEQVDRLGGRIVVEHRAGAGTLVRTIVPASIVTFRGLLVGAGGQPFLLPIAAVERALRIALESLQRVEGREVFHWQGRAVPIGRLDALLRLPGHEGAKHDDERALCVVVAAGKDCVGLVVDEILGEREVLVKELGWPLVRVRNTAGAGLLGTGEIVLILRPSDLLRSLRESTPPPPTTAAERAPSLAVLVVDDSITTRTMERNILEAAGYRVRVAADGVEGWTILRSEPIDLVVSDVDMPRMDGFELTARIRADKTLTDLPVVLVTALESTEDRERGIEVGANAYIVKSSFEQSNLLEIIDRFV